MPKVICTLPNASELISGVKFISHKLGVISEEIEQEVADEFLKIKGYVLAGKKAAEPEKAPSSDAATGANAAQPKTPDAAAQAVSK